MRRLLKSLNYGLLAMIISHFVIRLSNMSCLYILHQPEVPEALNRFKRI